MTIYYTLTFMLLAAEMVTFLLFVAPLPFAIRKRFFNFLATSPIIGKLAYGLKISFIFIAILFVDALQRMFRVATEVEAAKSSGGGMHDVRSETNFAARKFYFTLTAKQAKGSTSSAALACFAVQVGLISSTSRNVYLTGFCLFLSVVHTRTFYIIQDLIHAQEEYANLKQATAGESRDSGDAGKQIAELKKKLAEKEQESRDFATLKKQASQQAAEYDRLAEQYNKETGKNSSKRRD